MPTNAQIQADIDVARQQFRETQELYREACTILFFRYGITPTANKLYQYVRKGSMSAPAEALVKFWDDLREKSRVRIEHPDLPDSLKSVAGELVAALWAKAQGAAHENLAVFRSEIQAGILEAQTALSSVETARLAAILERDQAREAAQAATGLARQAERDLAAERAAKEVLTQQLKAATGRHDALEAALAEARHDFAAELEKLRVALQRSEDRCEDTEKRALLEIDRERMAAAKVQKELVEIRQKKQAAAEKHRDEVVRLQADLGSTRQQLGRAEGMLVETQRTAQHQGDELQSLRKTLVEAETRATLLDRDLMACQENTVKLERRLAQRKSGSEPAVGGTKRKPRSKKSESPN